MNDTEKAINFYKKALVVDKGYLPAYTNLAFLYEKIGDIKNAVIYWKQRHDLGVDGEYWKEVARQHLLQMGEFPQVREERLQSDAALLSKSVVFSREQERLKAIDEARMHFNIARNFMAQGDFTATMRECEAARFFKPEDTELLLQIEDLNAKAKKSLLKYQAQAAAQAALDSIKNEDYDTASSKLRESGELVAPLSR
jgi:tetratricopeptide (TPR) repeat protein